MASAFSYEQLWNKSKLFIDKALQARDDGDDVTYHLWSSVSLELLGRASLARLHPALVADPNHFSSLLAACGKQTTPSMRSIQASTLYERLHLVFPEFDKRTADQCMVMASRRNAELHSGESPMIGIDPRAWVPVLWKAVAALLKVQDRKLDEWVSTPEAERARKILEDSAETLRQAVIARIERRQHEFAAAHPSRSQKLADAEQRAAVRRAPITFMDDEAYHQVSCPACGLPGWALGREYDRDILSDHYEDELGYFQLVRVTYTIESFRCDECHLALEGQDEIEIAELPAEFELDVEQEPDYEPDYGND